MRPLESGCFTVFWIHKRFCSWWGEKRCTPIVCQSRPIPLWPPLKMYNTYLPIWIHRHSSAPLLRTELLVYNIIIIIQSIYIALYGEQSALHETRTKRKTNELGLVGETEMSWGGFWTQAKRSPLADPHGAHSIGEGQQLYSSWHVIHAFILSFWIFLFCRTLKMMTSIGIKDAPAWLKRACEMLPHHDFKYVIFSPSQANSVQLCDSFNTKMVKVRLM